MSEISAEQIAAAQRKRRIFWTLVLLWGIASYFIGPWLAQDMRFRVNDLSVIPGAGYIARDPEGIYYHVNPAGKARAIFPTLEAPIYRYECLDCTLVTGEQMSQINVFCASAERATLPELQFEIPCRTWAPQFDLPNFLTFAVFLVPLIGWPILRFLIWGRRTLPQPPAR